MKTPVTFQSIPEYELKYERLLDRLREYERIYGTDTYTGNSTRDEGYRRLKQEVEEARSQYRRGGI